MAGSAMFNRMRVGCRGAGSWIEAGYHLATTIATPAAYAPLAFAFASLTWGGGLVWLL